MTKQAKPSGPTNRLASSVHKAEHESLPASGQEITLTQAQAGSWLDFLNEAIQRSDQDGTGLRRLRDELVDQCWLGRWKRENVQVQLDPSLLPDVLEALLQECELATSRELEQGLADIAKCLRR